jgi:hypothetical protein
MNVAMLTSAPTPEQIKKIQLLLSVFMDGSGQETDKHGTRPGWRDMERAVGVWLEGRNPANKEVFDVIVSVPTPEGKTRAVGVSAKSKELKRLGALGDLATSGRVYMELCNSPAKLWAPLIESGITEADFKAKRRAQEIGSLILGVVRRWHNDYKILFERENPTVEFDLTSSAFLTLSYKTRADGERSFQLHSFDLDFPEGISWQYATERCLRGFDPANEKEVLFDWYGLSGGQLKYYPRASLSRFATPPFELIAPPREMSLCERAARYWPSEWKECGEEVDLPIGVVTSDLRALYLLSSNEDVKKSIHRAAEEVLGQIAKNVPD